MDTYLRFASRAIALTAMFLALLAIGPQPLAQSAANDRQPDQAIIWPQQSQNYAPASTGYLSPPTEAARPFTHMLLRREASVPEGATMTLLVRVSSDGTSWTEWHSVLDNEDLHMPSDGPDVEWSQTLDAGGLARYWQIQTEITPAPDGALPQLQRIEVNTVDASGPQVARPTNIAPNTTLSKPSVVSRTAWGSPDGQGSRVKPVYYPVKHMVVHHTADPNTLRGTEPNWGARVLAEWSFHTYSRGWGDVGYNYLIDPNGVIYEGRAGSDDAVAFHDTANYGSMGVALIGTYTSVAPTAATQDALVALLAWKAEQKGIDPLARSYYYGCNRSSYCLKFNPGAIVLNIAGHRQVTPGHTTCPGDTAVSYLPGIRNRVKQALSNAPSDNGDTEIDELESSFTKSNANWYTSPCGAGGNTLYTFATNNPAESTNRGEWRPAIASGGTYRVFAHIPEGCESSAVTTSATYTIHSATGTFNSIIDQSASGGWVDLGLYSFDAGSTGYVELTDLTGESFGTGRKVYFDSVKWVPESANTNVQIDSLQFDRTTLASGELLKITFNLRNIGPTTVRGQAPRVDLTANGGLGGLDNSYTYDQDECFAGDPAASYPIFPKETDRFRVTLGTTGWDSTHTATCIRPTSDYPWRWGINSDLAPAGQPGDTQTIVGYVRFRVPGTYTLQSGVIQEYVRYHVQGFSPTVITVTPEKTVPDLATYDSSLRPLARVYNLGAIPDNFLSRTLNPLSIPRGQAAGSFAWDGSFIDWGDGGPNGLTDRFMIEQTRSFTAPITGTYTFQTTSDDGSWLWVNGQLVVVNAGIHVTETVTGSITLAAGRHRISFMYFDRGGASSSGYAMRIPGGNAFYNPPDILGDGLFSLGGTFVGNPDLLIVADDRSGSGVTSIRWSLDGITWKTVTGSLLRTGKLANGTYRLRYQARDAANNLSPVQELSFKVNSNLRIYRSYHPVIRSR